MKLAIGAKPFLHGLLVAGLVYILIAVWIVLSGPAALEKMEASLASSNAVITRSTVQSKAEKAVTAPNEPVPTVDLDNHTVTPTKTAPEVVALPAAPIEGLYEKVDSGLLPKKAPDGATPFSAYSRPAHLSGKPVIALMMDDYGLSESASQKALDSLPPQASFILSSYSANAPKWMQEARAKGHELWMKVNFETASYPHSDPGPQAMLANASLKYNQDRLIWNLTRASGYAGIAGGTDYIFESASSILQPLIKFIYARGLGYYETNKDASEMIETLAVAAKAPYARGDVMLDGSNNIAHFAMLESTAKERGYAVATLKPYTANFDAVKTWIAGLTTKGFEIVPVSAIAGAALSQPAEMEETVAPAPATSLNGAP